MKLALCIDDEGGMLFCGRRQSRDRLLLADLFSMREGGELYVEPFSDRLLADLPHAVISREELSSLKAADIFFAECPPIAPLLPFAETLILYRWNRIYPKDESVDISFSALSLAERTELVGSSHEKITKEVYHL